MCLLDSQLCLLSVYRLVFESDTSRLSRVTVSRDWGRTCSNVSHPDDQCSGPLYTVCCFEVFVNVHATLSKAWVCGRSLAGIAGSNTPGAWMVVPCKCSVYLSRGLCDGLMPRAQESYGMWRVLTVCDLKTSTTRRPKFN